MKQTWKCSQCLTSLMSVFGYGSGLGKGPRLNRSLACASSGGIGVFQGRAQWEEVRSLRQSLEGILRSRPILLSLFASQLPCSEQVSATGLPSWCSLFPNPQAVGASWACADTCDTQANRTLSSFSCSSQMFCHSDAKVTSICFRKVDSSYSL